MARRDNVKARRRLKKPKKIYTNTPMDKGFGKLKTKRFEKPYKGGHTWARAVYMDRNGTLRVKRSVVKEIRLPLQKAKSPITSFNKWGLQTGNSPQKIHYLMGQMDAQLISQKIAPHIRQQIMAVWQKYKSAAWGFYRAKDPERQAFHFNVIRQIELNPQLLGLRGTEIKDSQKHGYFINNTPYEKQVENYDYYEKWYNKMLDREIVIRDITLHADAQAFTDQDTVTEYEDDETLFHELGGASYIKNDPGDWEEYWFYSPETVASIIQNMGGWHNAQTLYPDDTTRVCNNAGYNVEQMYNHLVHGEKLGAPNKELVYETIGTGHGASFDVWEISTSTGKTRKK